MSLGIIVLGFDYDKHGKDIGFGTRARCRQAATVFFKNLKPRTSSPTLVMSPGFNPGEGRDTQVRTMSAMMLNFMHEKYGIDIDNMYLGNPVWGSRYEILEGTLVLREYEWREDPLSEVIVVSHDFHLPRLRRICNRVTELLDVNWEWKFSGVPSARRQWIREFPRLIGEMYRLPRWNPPIRPLE